METFNIAERFYAGPILIPYHIHPVIHCIHDSTCDKCNKRCEEGSFCCTFCDYDCCDNCFKELELYKILFYNPLINPNEQKPKKKESKSKLDFSDKGWILFKCHQIHSLPKIAKGSETYDWNWQCSNCKQFFNTYNMNDPNNIIVHSELYYCSLCNYSLCLSCAEKNKSS